MNGAFFLYAKLMNSTHTILKLEGWNLAQMFYCCVVIKPTRFLKLRRFKAVTKFVSV